MADMEQWERDYRHGERNGWHQAMGLVLDVVNEIQGHDRQFGDRIHDEVYDRLRAELDIRLPAPPPHESKAS